MTQSKGLALNAVRRFVSDNFGEEGYQRWLSALSEEARSLYERRISAITWYSTTTYYLEPLEIASDLFFDSDNAKTGEKYGRFSAHFALNRLFGLSSIILGRGGPAEFVRRSNKIVSLYHKPCRLEVTSELENGVMGRLSDFDEITKLYEYVIIGFTKQGLEHIGCSGVGANITKSQVEGDDYTEYMITWSE